MKRYLIVCLGYFGRGATLEEAYENVRNAGATYDQRAILTIGMSELKFIDALTIEGEILVKLRVDQLRHLKNLKHVEVYV